MQRPDPSYPIWDENTTTLTIAAASSDVTKVTPAGVYYVIVSVGSPNVDCYIRDSRGTDSLYGILLGQDTAGDVNYGFHVAPGSDVRVTRTGSTTLTFTYFYNTIS